MAAWSSAAGHWMSFPGVSSALHALLGHGHISPFAGQAVTAIPGVVTFVTSNAFFLQDPNPVGGPFKQAIEVFTSKRPTVTAGDDVTVSGTVSEFFPNASTTPSSPPITEITSPTVTVVSSGNPVPAPIVIAHGILPPAQNILGGRKSTDLTTVNSFLPALRALDFYQGLDSALAEVENPVAVEATNGGASAVAPDNGLGAGLRTPAGGLAETRFSVNSRRLAVFPFSGVTALSPKSAAVPLSPTRSPGRARPRPWRRALTGSTRTTPRSTLAPL